MRARRFLGVFLMALAAPQMASAVEPESDDRIFDLRPSLDDALIAQLALSEGRLEPDPLLRQQRAAALMMPMMAPEGGGGGK